MSGGLTNRKDFDESRTGGADTDPKVQACPATECALVLFPSSPMRRAAALLAHNSVVPVCLP